MTSPVRPIGGVDLTARIPAASITSNLCVFPRMGLEGQWPAVFSLPALQPCVMIEATPGTGRIPTVALHRFPCPKCGKTLKVDDAMLEDIRRRGKGGHCPRCKSPVPVEGMGSPDTEDTEDTEARSQSPNPRRLDGGSSG